MNTPKPMTDALFITQVREEFEAGVSKKFIARGSRGLYTSLGTNQLFSGFLGHPDADGLWISPKLMREFYKLHVCSQHEQLQKELTSLFADHFGRIQSNSRHPDQKEQS